MISKTCKEASKSISARGGAPKEEYMFVNAEEEFFYEVKEKDVNILLKICRRCFTYSILRADLS